jgi:hypothetical protein
VESVNRRLANGVQPDLVLVNNSLKKVIVHDITSQPNPEHLEKGERYAEFLKQKYPGYKIEYTETYWHGLEDTVEAKSRTGERYLPGGTKP